MSTSTTTPPARRAEAAALWALAAFTAVAVLGYWAFALNPDRLAGNPTAARFYAVSFTFFAQLHILLSAVALGVVLVGRVGARWLPALGAVYALSFTAEHLGTGYGIPFGGYGYTALLGPKLGGRVPALIPLSWFLMSLPAFVVAWRAFPARRAVRVVVAAALLVAWDLALDPAMSYLTPYWVWEETGPYYGMPWMNLLGWFVTGLVIMAALEFLSPRLGLERLPVRWLAAYYGVVLLMPLGMLLAAGHLLAVVVTAVALAALGWTVRGAFATDEAARTAPDAGTRGPTRDAALVEVA